MSAALELNLNEMRLWPTLKHNVLVETHLTGQLLLSLKKPWVGWLYQAPYSAHSRGIAISVAKTVQFSLLTMWSDPQGKFQFIHAMLNGLELLLLAFYIPPPFQFNILTEGLAFMAQFPSVPALWMGDFNAILDTNLDRIASPPSTNHTPSPMRFGKLMNEFALVDTWRHTHPTDRAFSCFSASYNTMSRIDLILISQSLVPTLSGAGFSPRILSDHAPYWIEVKVSSPSFSYAWRLNPF